jgi:hypothetical protein
MSNKTSGPQLTQKQIDDARKRMHERMGVVPPPRDLPTEARKARHLIANICSPEQMIGFDHYWNTIRDKIIGKEFGNWICVDKEGNYNCFSNLHEMSCFHIQSGRVDFYCAQIGNEL